MTEILLAGAYGQHNPGDEALLAAFLRQLDGHSVAVTSQDPVATEQRWGCAAVPPSGRAALSWLRSGSHLVIGGGTVFKTLHPTTDRRPTSLLARTDALVRAARARGVTVSLIGVGADELAGPVARRLARDIARRCDVLVVRDAASSAILADAGVPTPLRVGADAAWTGLADIIDGRIAVPRPAGPQGRPVLVALSHLAGGPDLADRLAEGLAAADLGDRAVHLQPWQTGDSPHDLALAEQVAERLGSVAQIVPPPADLRAAAVEMVGYDAVVGLRFHSLVAAAAAGVPFLAIDHEPKLSELARRFQQRSMPLHASTPLLGRAVELTVTHPAPSAVTAREELARSLEGFRLLRLVITGGRDANQTPPARLTLSAGAPAW
ncbi:MAG: polysaccharide pyruvyl transferase family protein [Acidimicrobiales bacterium]